MYKMQIVLKAVNQDHTFDLIDGDVWYPIVRFIDKKKAKKKYIMKNLRFLISIIKTEHLLW